MILSFARRSAFVALAIGVAACTEPTPPTAPTLTTFQPILEPILNPKPAVDGVYQGTMLFTGVTGGTGALRQAGTTECTAEAYVAAFNNGNQFNDASMSITQDKTIITNVTVRLASEETGLACKFTGAIGSANGLISDALPEDCTGTTLILRCIPDPVTGIVLVRELRLVSSSLSATFDGWPTTIASINGRTAQTYNVFDAASEKERGNAVGGLVVNHSFFMNRR
jgi:hypothetical protein